MRSYVENRKRKRIRELHAKRGAAEIKMSSEEWKLRVAIGNITQAGAPRKMGGKVTDRNSKIYLLIIYFLLVKKYYIFYYL